MKHLSNCGFSKKYLAEYRVFSLARLSAEDNEGVAEDKEGVAEDKEGVAEDQKQ